MRLVAKGSRLLLQSKCEQSKLKYHPTHFSHTIKKQLFAHINGVSMQRWDANTMNDIGAKLFDKIHRKKMHSHHNHDIHFLARDQDWLPLGIQSLIDGNYEPRCLKRYYFTDEMVDQLHISDRVFQHILLRILKPTFKFVMNPNCYHLDGPTGVKNATQKIREVLQNTNPKYFIRTDIKSFYKSIPHYKLIQDIKKYYNDPTQIADNTNTQPVIEKKNMRQSTHDLNNEGGADFIQPSQDSSATFCVIPHARTLRKAREQVKMMVADDVSLPKIKKYLSRWVYWWVRTSSCWNYCELVNRYIHSCWNPTAKNMAIGFFQSKDITLSCNDVQACGRTLAQAA